MLYSDKRLYYDEILRTRAGTGHRKFLHLREKCKKCPNSIFTVYHPSYRCFSKALGHYKNIGFEMVCKTGRWLKWYVESVMTGQTNWRLDACVCECVCDYGGLEGLEQKHAVLTFQPDPRLVQLNGLALEELHLSVKMKAEEKKTKDDGGMERHKNSTIESWWWTDI